MLEFWSPSLSFPFVSFLNTFLPLLQVLGNLRLELLTSQQALTDREREITEMKDESLKLQGDLESRENECKTNKELIAKQEMEISNLKTKEAEVCIYSLGFL